MRKQLLYLTNTQLTAFLWQAGSLSEGSAFENDEAGWQAFSEHVGQNHNVPVFMLADLIEEDFQREVVPHVNGKAHHNLMQRRLSTLYRDSPFRHASPQGREKEGRRDDRVLFSALTNASLLKPWLDAIEKAKTPLAAIHSVALLSSQLFRKLAFGTEPLLLVSHQSAGLRQTYFHEGYLRFSRLTRLANHDPQAVAEAADTEMGKTRQFLTSTRLMPRGVMMSIIVLADAGVLEKLQPMSPDTPEMLHRFVDLDETAQLLGLKNLAGLSLCDPLFLAMLGTGVPVSHCATGEQTRLYKFWQARIGLFAFSALTLTGSLAWGAVNTVDWFEAAGQTRQLEQETRAALTRNEQILKSTPATAANPTDMKAVVELQRMLSNNAPTPQTHLGEISRALELQPQIRITELRWQTSDQPPPEPINPAVPQSPPASPPPAPAADAPLAVALIGVPKKPYEIIQIDGEVVQQQTDYKLALESVKQMAAELAKNKQLQVEIARPPVDTRPDVKLQGKAGEVDLANRPQFSLKLYWKP